MAKEAEKDVKDGKTHWECIRNLQQAHAGHKPCIPSTVRKVDEELTSGPSDHQHFSRLLNQQSVIDEEVIQQMPVVSPRLEFDDPPSIEELELAL